MAKIKQGILGGFSGKVAGVVGTSWKGRAVMKSRPLSVANPRTDAQQEQRGKFSKIAELASKVLTTFVQPVENPISGDISGYNKFVKDNKAAFNALGEIEDSNFVCGGGKLINLASNRELEYSTSEKVKFKWTNSGGESTLRMTDKVFVLGVSNTKDYILVSSGTATRTATTADLNKIYGEDNIAENDQIIVLYACVSADGREVSVLTTAETLEVPEV